MRVLSCFDGISCGQVALERAGFKPSVYFASEIDKHAITVTQSNYPKTVQLGCVKNVVGLANSGALGSIDLLIGGSPCQGFSRAGLNLGFDDPRSKLLFDFVHIKSVLKPKYWLLENVRMSDKDMNFISILMGGHPVMIDSQLFSAQKRQRLYWTNIPIAKIIDKQIMLWMITGYFPTFMKQLARGFNPGFIREMIKTPTMSTSSWEHNNLISKDGKHFNIFNQNQLEMLQNLPIGYTKMVSRNRASKLIGNGWTVDVIAHIMRGML